MVTKRCCDCPACKARNLDEFFAIVDANWPKSAQRYLSAVHYTNTHNHYKPYDQYAEDEDGA